MDETTRNTIVALAEQNGIAPDQLLAIATADGLPQDLQQAMAAILGDITIFGHALDKLDR